MRHLAPVAVRRYDKGMVAAIKQRVTVQAGGLIEVRSPELRQGQQADVIVLIESAAATPPRPEVDPTGDTPLARLQKFAGAFDSGDPHASDNERIDADLANTYGATNAPRT